MLSYIFAILIIISAAAAIINGKTSDLAQAILSEPVNAVELCIYLCGGMCYWGGIMRIADKSGLTDKVSKLLSVVLGRIFKGLDKNGKAFKAICMTLTANMLGLGNAATPLGIEAMKAMAEEENAADDATPSMIRFTVMNTASVAIIPTTALSMQLKYGAAEPARIVPAVWLAGSAAFLAALAAAIAINTNNQ